MWKTFSALCLVGALSGLVADTALGCGGGGGCGSGGGGRGRYGGARSVASSKVLSGGPRVARMAAPARANTTAVAATRSTTPLTTVVNTKTKTRAVIVPLYTCPVHPQVQWTKPTECPICGMKLKLKKIHGAAESGSPVADQHAAVEMDDTADDEAMGDMPDMDGMMMCPGCMMGMGGAPGTDGGKQAPAASRKAGGRMSAMAGMGCGC